MVLFDRNGRPKAFCDDGTHIFLFSGEPVAYFYGDAVYTFKGKQLGWFEAGWVRDMQGKCVFYWEKDTGYGPVKMTRGVVPTKGVKRTIPVKCTRAIRPTRAINKLDWSPLSGIEFFQQ